MNERRTGERKKWRKERRKEGMERTMKAGNQESK